MFKIYFEANTKNYCINIAKCMNKFLPYLEYTSPYIYNHQLIKKEKLKIGFLSLYFHNYHSVFACFTGNLLVNLNDMDAYFSNNQDYNSDSYQSEDENVLYEKQPVNDIYEYDQKVIDIFNDIKQYVKDENISICEMLKIDDIYEILEE